MENLESTTLLDFVERVRAWIPRRADPSKISRDFWMPDHSCRVCYECDSQFTIFNRRHHCRICGRVFCRKCTQNTIPVPSDGRSSGEEGERIRVCNFCFKICTREIITSSSSSSSASPSQWNGNGNGDETQLANSPSSHSGTSGNSSSHSGNSFTTNIASTMPYPTGPYQHISSPRVKAHQMEDALLEREQGVPHLQSNGRVVSSIEGGASSPSRSDDERDEYGKDLEDTQQSVLKDSQEYFGNHGSIDLDRGYILHDIHADDSLSLQNSMEHSVYHKGLNQNENYGKNLSEKIPSFQSDTLVERQMSGRSERSGEESEDTENVNDCNDDSAMFQSQSPEIEQPFDFENNGAIWMPPEPVDAEDEIESSMLDDDDDDDEGGWGLPRSSGSFSSNEYKSKDRSIEEHRDALRSVVDGHFRALVAQLLKGEEVFVGEENDSESWLEIVTSLSWQAATFVKPDTSKGGGMDPGLYVKVKCVASGRRSESKVVKGVVCSKNVKHKRMTQRYKNPRLLLLAGALEYQRISNQLSSLDTLLQQEMDHLKMTVSRIEAHHPNVLLVEKTVSHHAQEYLLTREISLVLNVKKPLLERIARCTGAQIVPSLDNLAAPKVGHCELFHVEKFLEEHESAGQVGRRQTKTLMFFEGCPKRLGCTVLLMGSNRDELKKIKHVLQYTVFAAYHLALETSFLADEGATLPELPLKSPITVALPDKQSSLDRSISTIPGFTVPVPEQIFSGELQTFKVDNSMPNPSLLAAKSPILDNEGNGSSGSLSQLTDKSSSLSNGPVETRIGFRTSSESAYDESTREKQDVFPIGQWHPLLSAPLGSVSALSASLRAGLDEMGAPVDSDAFEKITSDFEIKEAKFSNTVNGFVTSVASRACLAFQMTAEEPSLELLKENQEIVENEMNSKKFDKQNAGYRNQEQVLSKEDFPPSPSDHQSILVLLSSRCVLKGTVCERSQLFRIKYYGSFDKPLGRYLRDDLFGQEPRRCCGEPSEAHVLCYTHRQGSLTISVKRVPLLLTLPGEREGKIWMWHRCLKCARKDGVPEATRRVVMSDAAWGLSFGKFLELSFSNHAAASRVASCGHSLHRDCLRFYGFGSMIACFRYSSINVLSVYLPPSKLEFNDPNQQEWLRKEAKEVADKVELFYAEVFDFLREMGQKIASSGSLYTKVSESRRQIAELEELLQMQKAAIEEILQRAIPSDWQQGKPVADVLELNRLRRYLLCLSYSWDRQLRDLDSSLTTKDVRIESNPPENVRTPHLKDSSSLKELVELQITSKGNCNTGGLGCPGIEEFDSKFDGNNPDKADMSGNLHSTVIQSGDGNAICDGLVQPALANDFHKPFDNKLKESCSMNGKLDDGVKTFEVAVNRVTPNVDDMECSDHCTRDLSAITEGMLDNLDVENGECCTHARVSEKMSVETVASKYSQGDSEGDHGMHTVPVEGHFRVLADLSDTLDAAWTGEGQSASVQAMLATSQVLDISPVNGTVVACGGEPAARKDFQPFQQTVAGGKTTCDSILNGQDKGGMEVSDTSTPTSPVKLCNQSEDFGSWIGAPLSNLSKRHSRSFKGTVLGSIRLDSLIGYSPKFVSLFSNLGSNGGRLVLPSGVNNTVIAVYDDEPTSIISYALSSHEYQASLYDNGPDNEKQKEKDRDKEKEYAESLGMPIGISYPISSSDSSSDLVDFLSKERGSGSEDMYSYSLKGSNSGISDLSRPVHVKVSFTDEGLPGKTKYTVTCYFAREFDALRRKCCPTETDFRLSLSRCKKWGAQGGKSNVFFAKSLDDRFVIKQVTRTELDSFIKFAPEYFKYLTDSLSSGSPTCLAKILGIYQVIMKHAKGGREIRMDLMVMENLLFRRNVTRVYDLKGSGRSRYNSDSTGSNKVLLDQNLLEAMPTAPIFLGNKAKRLLERAVWNDTSFLASIDVMDYSLLVGVDEDRCELVLGIIDFMRQYTWDKHLETWVKASGILGGPKNTSPTVISPKQYKKRFRKAMSHYFLMVPDQWYPPAFIPSPSHTDVTESGSSFLTRDDGGDQLV
ncbi:hypothetical protein SUGI_0218340 [Cryptomeria japonica]|uniref:1-phosphatidylinositol-3-phosphate 5-kinase FAB1B n=1 Tax=Cryptomeria japonica TaxID=3369 RepID=UPI002408EE12|nr:1-phosphatidylinositol-3-phosphate 5-kinase FAB1B [Cryptomeria japonica]GLJ13693.1 hypothetical protein SUGI_0218340 [Cryptomeria japonica]